MLLQTYSQLAKPMTCNTRLDVYNAFIVELKEKGMTESTINWQFKRKYEAMCRTQACIDAIRQSRAWIGQPLSKGEEALKAEIEAMKEIQRQSVLDAVRREAPYGLLHSLLSEEERGFAGDLVVRGLLRKGNADTRQRGVAYYLVE